MNNGDSEKEIIMQLYRDGKITEKQKNALLGAVDPDGTAHIEAHGKQSVGEKKKVVFKVTGMDGRFEASRVSSAVANVAGVQKATADITCGELTVVGDFDADGVAEAIRRVGSACKPISVEFTDEPTDSEPGDASYFDDVFSSPRGAAEHSGDTAEPEDKKSETAEGKPSFSDRIAEFGRKVSGAVRGGLDSLLETEDMIAKYFDRVIYGNADEVEVKSKPEKYDGSYADVTISVKIINDKGVVAFTEKGSDIAVLLRECAAVMNDASFEALNSLLEKKFVGKYKYVCGSDVFKLIVKPR